MNMERYPDIEIYLAPLQLERLQEWLRERISADLVAAGKRRWRGTGRSESGTKLPILLIEAAADGFSSLWIDSPDSPWPRDVDLARAINQALAIEVRCSLGGWQPGDAPDRFLHIDANGEEWVIEWPDSGI